MVKNRVVGGGWGFEPTFILGEHRLILRAGEVHGKDGNDQRLRSGIAADSREGGGCYFGWMKALSFSP